MQGLFGTLFEEKPVILNIDPLFGQRLQSPCKLKNGRCFFMPQKKNVHHGHKSGYFSRGIRFAPVA
ncbi:MAG: hypothetical protein CM1200mP3_12100 [Chloroflexota bacterium]|nr:MAG: hypothetical protein CM1200mP3_12100 [Chloroflexota bacterium]